MEVLLRMRRKERELKNAGRSNVIDIREMIRNRDPLLEVRSSEIDSLEKKVTRTEESVEEILRLLKAVPRNHFKEN